MAGTTIAFHPWRSVPFLDQCLYNTDFEGIMALRHPFSTLPMNYPGSGMEAESADLGMVITTGTFSDDAVRAANEYLESVGKKIELVDGEQFAKMIVEHGTGES